MSCQYTEHIEEADSEPDEGPFVQGLNKLINYRQATTASSGHQQAPLLRQPDGTPTAPSAIGERLIYNGQEYRLMPIDNLPKDVTLSDRQERLGLAARTSARTLLVHNEKNRTIKVFTEGPSSTHLSQWLSSMGLKDSRLEDYKETDLVLGTQSTCQWCELKKTKCSRKWRSCETCQTKGRTCKYRQIDVLRQAENGQYYRQTVSGLGSEDGADRTAA